MSERKDTQDGTVHRLDTRQAELGAGLRRLFQPLIEEPVPDELAELSQALESKLTGDGLTDETVERDPDSKEGPEGSEESSSR